MSSGLGEVAAVRTSSTRRRRSFFAAIVHRWRDWRSSRARVAELSNFTSEELQDVARDVGATAAELRVLAGKWPDAADLLMRRMAVLGLDAAELAHSQPGVSNDLKKLCSLCASKRQCENDLITHPRDQVWEQYCPNCATLAMLRDEQAKHPKNPRDQ